MITKKNKNMLKEKQKYAYKKKHKYGYRKNKNIKIKFLQKYVNKKYTRPLREWIRI